MLPPQQNSMYFVHTSLQCLRHTASASRQLLYCPEHIRPMFAVSCDTPCAPGAMPAWRIWQAFLLVSMCGGKQGLLVECTRTACAQSCGITKSEASSLGSCLL